MITSAYRDFPKERFEQVYAAINLASQGSTSFAEYNQRLSRELDKIEDTYCTNMDALVWAINPYNYWTSRGIGHVNDILCAYCHTPLEYTPYPQNGWGDVMREIGNIGTCDRCGGPVERVENRLSRREFAQARNLLREHSEPAVVVKLAPGVEAAFEAYSKAIEKSTAAGLVNWRTD